MPVDNDTGGGTQYTITHPRPVAPPPGDIAAAIATGVAAAIQLYTIFGTSGDPSGAQITAVVATLLGFLILVVTIIQNGVSQDVVLDIPSDPAAWTELKPQQKGGNIPNGIVATDMILFRDPDTSNGMKIQTTAGGVSTTATTVHLVLLESRDPSNKPKYTCTFT